MVMHVCMVRWPSANMFMRHASKRCSLATDQKSITTAPWLLTMEVCASPIPDVVLLPPFLILDLSVFFPALLSFANWNDFNLCLFVVCTCSVCFMEIRALILPLSLASPSLSLLKLSVFVLSPTSYRLLVSGNCPNESFDSPTGIWRRSDHESYASCYLSQVPYLVK